MRWYYLWQSSTSFSSLSNVQINLATFIISHVVVKVNLGCDINLGIYILYLSGEVWRLVVDLNEE